MLVGEAIDCQVVANAFQYRRWQGRPVHTPGEISEDAAHTRLGGVRGEEGVGEVVHFWALIIIVFCAFQLINNVAGAAACQIFYLDNIAVRDGLRVIQHQAQHLYRA